MSVSREENGRCDTGWIFYLFKKKINRPSRLGLRTTPTAPLQKGKTPPMSVLDMTQEQSNGEASVIPSLPGSLLSRVLSMGQIELFNI